MRKINPQLTTKLKKYVNSDSIEKSDPIPVKSYRELVEHVAQLSYANKDFLLFFRGQERDYRNKAGATTLYPSIYRGEVLESSQLDLRFDLLTSAGKRLCNVFQTEKVEGYSEVRRRSYIQWSILQHYEVCSTPLLDVTHSLLVACSFAFLMQSSEDPIVYVLGFPYLPNRLSINSEYDLAIVRLLSICPPEALRPYFQDGYLAGTDGITAEYDSKDELDFNRVLIAKFSLNRSSKFWVSGFKILSKNALYPPNDRVEEICMKIRSELGTTVEPGRLGQFLQAWTDLENYLMTEARVGRAKVYSLREALSILRSRERFSKELLKEIDYLRQIRNSVVHQPQKVDAQILNNARLKIENILKQVKLKFYLVGKNSGDTTL